MTFEEYLEFDKLMWKNKQTKRARQLMEKWQALPKSTQEDYMHRKWNMEANQK